MSRAYGVDLGSRCVKIAAEDKDGFEYIGPFDTAGFYRTYIEPDAQGGVLRRDLLGLREDTGVVATGYGKTRLGRGAVMVPELEAIIAGVKALTGLTDALILDIGGQDSKALLMKNGRMEDFAANDRCAASSGRFLENMSTALGMDLEEMGKHWENPVELSSTCAIFGETELVGLMGEGRKIQDLAAGVNHTILRRLLPLISRFQAEVLVLTGGVAYNQALRILLGEAKSVQIVVPDPPDFIAAVGCCRLAGDLE